MQAIIMAAGKGSRLGAINEGKPKSFLEIQGTRLIDYNIAIFRSLGIKQIIIVTGYCAVAFERDYGGQSDIELVFNPFFEHANVIGSFWAGMHLLNDDFIFLHADSLCDPSIIDELIASDGDVVLPVDFDIYNEEAMGVRCYKGKAIEVSKKIPIDTAETGEFIGYAKVCKNMIPHVKKEVVKLLEEREFAEYFEASIQRLMDKKLHDIITISTNNRFWAEIDFEDDYKKAACEIPNSLIALAKANAT